MYSDLGALETLFALKHMHISCFESISNKYGMNLFSQKLPPLLNITTKAPYIFSRFKAFLSLPVKTDAGCSCPEKSQTDTGKTVISENAA